MGKIGGKSSRQTEEHVKISRGAMVCLPEDQCTWSPVNQTEQVT